MNKEVLQSNIDKVHTTPMGLERLSKNLGLDMNDVVCYCKNKVLDERCFIYKKVRIGTAK